MQKQEIRKTMKELKSRLTKEEQKVYSSIIADRLLKLPEYRQCGQIFCYVSFNQEVITTTLIEKALFQQQKVAVPKITGKGMQFFYIRSLKDLEPGILGIPEPVTEEEALPDITKDNLILVPGLAFDPHGIRIGYGKGYYDNFFRKYGNLSLVKIALAYDFQVLPELPEEEHDIRVDQIITQRGIIKSNI